jgi:hypothetical protein
MPPNTVYVGRPTKWGNYYKVGEPYPYMADLTITPKEAVYLFEISWSGIAIERGYHPDKWLDELRGKDLACWCALDKPCHADVLLKLANETTYELREEIENELAQDIEWLKG